MPQQTPSPRRAPRQGGNPAPEGVRVIKKYPNRRLYDTRSSSYITLADIKAMVMGHETFIVQDAKTAEDLTRAILLQIILEEEQGGAPIFSERMLAQMIRFYGHSMQGMMGHYLERQVQGFVDLQARLAEQAGKGTEAWTALFGNQSPLMQNWVEQSRSVMGQMLEQMQGQAKALWGVKGAPPGKDPD